MNTTPIEVGIGFYTPPKPRKWRRDDDRETAPKNKQFALPRFALIIDTETAAPETPSMPGFEDWRPEGQGLLFLRAVWCEWASDGYRARREYLVYPDDLPVEGVTSLRGGMRARLHGESYETDDPPHLPLELMPLSRFMPLFAKMVLSRKSYVVGFNLFFDLTRLAFDFKDARGGMRGGFALKLFRDANTPEQPHPFLPDLKLRRLDNIKTFFRWGTHRIPDGKGGVLRRRDGSPRYRRYEPLFIDVRMLLFALTVEKFSLDSAAKQFLPSDQWKAGTETHGVITPDYIAYNRQDCYTTLALLNVGLAEWRNLKISAPPHTLYSPASIAKAYLRDAGIQPRLKLQPDFPPEVLGYCAAAYFGGRVDTTIRRVRVPIVHVDFDSMYPTVSSLMRVWDFAIAEKVEAVPAVEEARRVLDAVTPDAYFDPARWHWSDLAMVVQIKPNGDMVPVRGRYNHETDNIGINPYYAPPAWYMMPDLIASTLLTGKPPEVLQAYRFIPTGVQPGLRPVMLRGAVKADPRTDDLIRLAIEERFKIKRKEAPYDAWTPDQRDATQQVLKIIANSGGYGINAERNKEDTAKPQSYDVYSDGKIAVAKDWREKPGPFYFSPLAALITAAARLMLALLEGELTRRGGTYATGDTDSMHIVADETAYDLAIEGKGADGQSIPQTVHVLSWDDVDDVIRRFTSLNPYPSKPGSILKVESGNFDLAGRRQRVWCYAVSSKRYCLLNDGGEIVKRMESSLADFWLPPLTAEEIRAETERRIRAGTLAYRDKPAQDELARRFKAGKPLLDEAELQREVENVLNKTSRITPAVTSTHVFITWAWDVIANRRPTAFEKWTTVSVIYQRAASTPHTYHQFDDFNTGKPLRDQIKPGNFFMRAAYYGQHEPGQRKRWGTIFAPYEPEKWFGGWDWRYGADGRPVEKEQPVTGEPAEIDANNLHVLGMMVRRYDMHPEYPYAGPDGEPCNERTRGVLSRRPVSLLGLFYTGKQTPRFEEVYDQQEDSDPRPLVVHDASGEALPLALDVLRDMDASEVATTFKTTPRAVQRWLAGKRAPKEPARVIACAIRYAQTVTRRAGLDALQAYASVRQTVIDRERAALAPLADWEIAARYGVSLRTAQRVKTGEMRPFREVFKVNGKSVEQS